MLSTGKNDSVTLMIIIKMSQIRIWILSQSKYMDIKYLDFTYLYKYNICKYNYIYLNIIYINK